MYLRRPVCFLTGQPSKWYVPSPESGNVLKILSCGYLSEELELVVPIRKYKKLGLSLEGGRYVARH